MAAACGLLVAAVALPSAGDARRAKKLGHTKHTPKPQCPIRCSALGSITGFQVRTDGRSGLFRMPEGGRIVAWSVKLSKPKKDQRHFFADLFHAKFRGDPSARISVLKRVNKRRFRLTAQSPAVNLSDYYDNEPVITLNHPLRAPKGRVVALTTPTWVPSLALRHRAPHSLWRGSLGRDKCGKVRGGHARPQQKKGSVRQYGCKFTDRLVYWAYYVPR